MKKVVKYLINGILGGIMIGMGGTIFLSLDNKVIGASLFAIGLFMIVIRGFGLYTGKIGYLFDNKLSYVVEIVWTIIGNYVGTFFVGYLLRFTRVYTLLHEKAISLCNIKLDDSIISIFILSLFCGLLMYLAVNGYRDMKDNFARYAGVFLCVIVFILCGFEHSVANMFYFAVANIYSMKVFGYLGIMILGNAIGSFIIPLSDKLKKVLD